MKPNKIKINKIKENRSNPRFIGKDKFKKLVKSLQEFPEMLKLRPIVVDNNNIILGGNMRYKAAVELGMKEIWGIQADDLTEKQKQEFIIKDNVGFGEWDWDVLANAWDIDALNDWGLNIPAVYFDNDEEPEIDKDKYADELETYIGNKIKQIVLYFNTEDYINAINDLEQIREKENLNDNTEVFLFLIKKYGL